MKYTGIILTVAVAVFLLFPTSAEATSFAKVGTAGAQFLKLGLGARGTAMGGAFVATADDPSAAYWNPACLVNVTGTQVQFTGTQWFGDILYGGAVVSKEFSGIGTFAVQYAMLHSGDMDVTTVEQPEGTGETFTCTDWVAGLSFSRMLTEIIFYFLVNEHVASLFPRPRGKNVSQLLTLRDMRRIRLQLWGNSPMGRAR